MLKAALKKQELHRKNHVLNQIFEYVQIRVRECKKRGLILYEIPIIIMGFPRYEIHDLYIRLKKYYKKSQEISINIIDGRIIIELAKIEKKKRLELNKILEEINSKIEFFIENDKTDIIYEIPVMLEGIPLYNYKKTIERISDYLKDDGFYVIQLTKTSIGISWKTAKIIHKKPKRKNNFTGTFKEPLYDKSLESFEQKLQKLKKKSHKLKNNNNENLIF
jgi:hypothetical protein